MRRALAEEAGWVRVHAAEALIALGEGNLARETYTRERAALESGPVRVGLWRVLAATASTPDERAAFVANITAAFLSEAAPDRLQALESLCKLRVPITGAVAAQAQAMLAGPELARPLANWAMHLAGDAQALPRLCAYVGSSDPGMRLRAAYALRWLRPLSTEVREFTAAAADAEDQASSAYPFILSTALALDANPARTSAWRQMAESILNSGTAGARYEICQALIQAGVSDDPSRYAVLFTHTEGDARIGGAWLVWHFLR